MKIDPTGRTSRINANANNLLKAVLTFDNHQLNDANNLNFLIWTFDILISNSYSSKNKLHVGDLSVKFPIRSNRAAKRELNKNQAKILETLVDLVVNHKNETEAPIILNAKFGGDNARKEHECTIKIIDTPNLKDKLKECGLITEEA